MISNGNIYECLAFIEEESAKKDRIIDFLRRRNEYIESEKYKNEELSRMKQEVESMRKSYYRGFPISEEEEAAIEAWKIKHDEEAHGITTFEQQLKAEGVSGGRYTYIFVPTAIGTFGKIRCSCGAEFEFTDDNW